MKISQFTRYTKCENFLLVYNSFNGAIARINDNISFFCDVIDNKKPICSDLQFSDSFMKNFCVDDSIDEAYAVEYVFGKRFFSSNKMHIICIVNNYCNFECTYCYEKHDKREFIESSYDNLYSSITNYLSENNIKTLTIEWYGGEPSLSIENIVDFLAKIKLFCDCHGIICKHAMTTNGYEINVNNFMRLYSVGVTSYQITIDGNRRLHDVQRPHKNGYGSWDIIMDNLKEISKLSIKYHIMIRINYTFETLECIDELLEYVSVNLDRNRFSVFFHKVSNWGEKSENNPDVLDDDVATHIFAELFKRARKYKINLIRHFIQISPFGGICYAALPFSFIISSDEKIRKCTFDMPEYDHFNEIGDISKGYLSFLSKNYVNFIHPRYHNDKCLNCDILPICMNMICPKSNLNNDSTVCYNKKIIDIIMEYKYYYLMDNIYPEEKLEGLM